MDTNAAIAALRNILATLENNEPINRTEGDTDQANLEMMNAKEIREAIAILEASLSPEEQEEQSPEMELS